MLVNSTLFRRIELQLLMDLTSRAIGQPGRRLWTRSCDEALRIYAEYTSAHLRHGADNLLLARMNAEAYKTGRRLRRLFRIRTQDEAEKLATVLYKHIGIVLEFSHSGQLCFRHCYFSQYYTPAACLAASALDDGILRGLTGCGHLEFTQRMTEGCACCRATTCRKPSKENDLITENI